MSTSYPHITIDPAVSAGRPCIAETGIRVTDVAAASLEGQSAIDLQEYFSASPRHLTLSEVYAALGYYHDHREDLELAFAADKRVSDAAEKDRLAGVMRRLLGQ